MNIQSRVRSPADSAELLEGAEPEIRSRVMEMLDVDSAGQVLSQTLTANALGYEFPLRPNVPNRAFRLP